MKIIQTQSFLKLSQNPCWEGYKMVGTKTKNGKKVPNCVPKDKEASSDNLEKEAKKTPAWQRSEGKSPAGGLNEKGRKSYERENPGSDLKPPVTEDKPTGKRKKRQDSYCARSKGQMDDHNINCRETPDKPICKSRKRWSC